MIEEAIDSKVWIIVLCVLGTIGGILLFLHLRTRRQKSKLKKLKEQEYARDRFDDATT